MPCVRFVLGQQIGRKFFDEGFLRCWLQKIAGCNLPDFALEQSFGFAAIGCARALAVDFAISVVLKPPVAAPSLLIDGASSSRTLMFGFPVCCVGLSFVR